MFLKFRPFKVNDVKTLSAISYGNNKAFNQDSGGEVHITDDFSSATLKGNAWKAFKLTSFHPVTEHTRLQFRFELKNEAEGHAICVEDNLDEDPFAGKHVRCVLVAGTQYNQWSHVKRENLSLALGRTAFQSHNIPDDKRGVAEKAIDGNMNTFTNTGIPNTSTTNFYVDVPVGFTVTEVKIYNRMDSFADRLNKFKIYVQTSSGKEIYSVNLDRSAVDAFGLVHVKDITIDEADIPSEDTLKVGMELNKEGSTSGYPHMIGEFEVFGKPIHNKETEFDIHVADLFPETDSKINYIILIQDNDSNPFLGESVFSQVRLVDTPGDNTRASIKRPFEPGEDPHPASPRSHVNFGSLSVPHAQSPWTEAKSKFPSREDGWDVAYDVLEDPKDYCYFTEVQTAGYNAKNRKQTDLNDFWKDLGGSVVPNRVKADGGRAPCR